MPAVPVGRICSGSIGWLGSAAPASVPPVLKRARISATSMVLAPAPLTGHLPHRRQSTNSKESLCMVQDAIALSLCSPSSKGLFPVYQDLAPSQY
jgi:hypothetical protein